MIISNSNENNYIDQASYCAKYINSVTQRICKTSTKEIVKKLIEAYGK